MAIHVDSAPFGAWAADGGKILFRPQQVEQVAESLICTGRKGRKGRKPQSNRHLPRGTFRAACSFSVCADGRLAPTGESRHTRPHGLER
jgi:hypothetical protein